MKIDGRKIAREIEQDLKEKVISLQKKNIQPHLVIILIGNDAGSKAYIRQKIKRGNAAGIRITLKRYPKHVSEKTLFRFIESLNEDTAVHGIIVQRPVPKQIDSEKLNVAILPEKDVDAFHPVSQYEPPLALAVMRLLQEVYSKQTTSPFAPSDSSVPSVPFKEWLTSKNLVFLGRGEAGGRPVITHVEKLGISHSIIHSKTEKPEKYLKEADIVISAVGKESVVRKNDLKEGVILIGVGLHKGSDGKLKGDYNEEDVKEIASFYTPTPGGVGPVNVTMLLSNLVTAAGS